MPDTEVLETPTADETAEEAALVSAFESSTETPTPEGTTTTPLTDKPAEETATETPATPAQTETTPAVEAALASFTQQEKDDLLKVLAMRGKIDEVLGTLGNIQQEVKSMRNGSGAVTVSKEDFEELIKAEFPEFAGFLAQGLNRVFGKMKPGASVNVQEALNTLKGPLIEEAKHQARNEACMEYLDDEHEGWRELVGVPDEKGTIPDTAFRRWVATAKPKNVHEKIFASKNGPFLAKVIQEFKDHQAKGKQPAKPAVDPKAQERKAHLAAAVDPKGEPAASAPTKSEEDEFVEETNRTLKARGGLV